jgi:ribonuclease BN (tRNA processing enzyme)
MAHRSDEPTAASQTSRRNMLKFGTGAVGATAAAAAVAWFVQKPTDPSTAEDRSTDSNTLDKKGTSAVILGAAGGPVVERGCHGIASAVVVDGNAYLIDAGHGTVDQFKVAGILENELRGILVTHLHSDHIADLYTLPFLLHSGARPLKAPFHVIGPGRAGALPNARANGRDDETVNPDNPTPGTEDYFHYSRMATAYDQNIRMRDEGAASFTDVVKVNDIELPDVGADAEDNLHPEMDPFEIYRDEHVRVTAILVEHPPVFPAFAFRFDAADGAVVFSGDSSLSENIVRLAKGADVLVHEAIDLEYFKSDESVPSALLEHLRESHADVDGLGALAQRAGVKTLVLNHLVPGDPDLVSASEWQRRAQQGFDGKVYVGKDQLVVPVGRD